MHRTNPARWRHSHDFGSHSPVAEQRTRIVIAITATMMVVEIVGGIIFHSMAVLADGWHMGTHVSAFLITAIAYHFTRRHAADTRYSFGTGKMGVLGGFASAVILSVVAFLMAGESIHRFFAPLQIHFSEAIGVASIALVVNLVCAFLLNLGDGHAHDHHHEHSHLPNSHRHYHHDLNLRAAYLHVLADAFTTFTAIIALVAAKMFGWSWLDPVVGLIGSGVVLSWAYGLLRATSGILLDRTPRWSDLPEEIRRTIESDGDSLISDLHVWQVGTGKFAAIVGVIGHSPKSAQRYRELLSKHDELVHVTLEVQYCHDDELVHANA